MSTEGYHRSFDYLGISVFSSVRIPTECHDYSLRGWKIENTERETAGTYLACMTAHVSKYARRFPRRLKGRQVRHSWDVSKLERFEGPSRTARIVVTVPPTCHFLGPAIDPTLIISPWHPFTGYRLCCFPDDFCFIDPNIRQQNRTSACTRPRVICLRE